MYRIQITAKHVKILFFMMFILVMGLGEYMYIYVFTQIS